MNPFLCPVKWVLGGSFCAAPIYGGSGPEGVMYLTVETKLWNMGVIWEMSWRDGSKEMSWIGAEHVPISAFLEEEVQMHCYHFSMLWIHQGSFESIILCHLQESVPGQCSSDVLKHPMVTQNGLFLAAQYSDSSHSPIYELFQIRDMSSWCRRNYFDP